MVQRAKKKPNTCYVLTRNDKICEESVGKLALQRVIKHRKHNVILLL